MDPRHLTQFADDLRRVTKFANGPFALDAVSDPGPPGDPPRPGLVWKVETQRWVRPDGIEAGGATTQGSYTSPPAELRKSPRMYTGTEPLPEIVNPIDPKATPQEKVRQLGALTAENKPKVDAFLKGLDAKFGTWSKSNVKTPESLLAKATRPSIKAAKPWHDAEHIRDSFRFKTVLKDARDLPGIIEHLEQNLGARIVKRDVDKFMSPGEWGWRITAFDLQMPNGQLVEYYLPVEEMEKAKDEGGNHHLFEKWRNRDLRTLSQTEMVAYKRDLEESRRVYQAAFDGYLSRSGATEPELRAALAKVAARPASVATNSERSSGVKTIPFSHVRPPSRVDAAKPSSSTTYPTFPSGVSEPIAAMSESPLLAAAEAAVGSLSKLAAAQRRASK